MTSAGLWRRARGACQRRAARWLGRRPFLLPAGPALVSFTFDDFPRSALEQAGAILRDFGLGATYYTSLGLAGQTTVCGEMFRIDDLPHLLESGHELGCHTFDHCPSWETPPAEFEEAVVRNADALTRILNGAAFRTLSYPLNHPHPGTKRRLATRFACCRGGGQSANTGLIDCNNVSAFFLEQSADDLPAVAEVIRSNQAAGGWLVFATHDVCARPSPYGCTPEFFRRAVTLAVDAGAVILPMARAWDVVRARGSLQP